jgi:hypothetical protein
MSLDITAQKIQQAFMVVFGQKVADNKGVVRMHWWDEWNVFAEELRKIFDEEGFAFLPIRDDSDLEKTNIKARNFLAGVAHFITKMNLGDDWMEESQEKVWFDMEQIINLAMASMLKDVEELKRKREGRQKPEEFN